MENMQLPYFSFTTTFLIMTIVMVARYFLLCLSFALFHKISPFPPLSQDKAKKKNIRHDVISSLVSSLIFAFFATLLIKGWQQGLTHIYLDFHAYPLWYLPVSLVLYLLIHDAYFYWTHRLFHLPAFLKFHLPHHISRTPTAWTSLAFHPIETLSHAIFLPVMVLICPIHWSMLGIYLLIMGLFGTTNHLGYEIYPAWPEKKLKLITATHHQKHHQNLNYNFGLYFTFWDLLMKTELKKENQ